MACRPAVHVFQEDEGVWVPESEDAESPEQQEQVPLDRVLRMVETAYGQRQDKEHNPHGEHAHDVWQVSNCTAWPLLLGWVLGSWCCSDGMSVHTTCHTVQCIWCSSTPASCGCTVPEKVRTCMQKRRQSRKALGGGQ